MDALMNGFMYGLGGTLGVLFGCLGFVTFAKLIAPPKKPPPGGSNGV